MDKKRVYTEDDLYDGMLLYWQGEEYSWNMINHTVKSKYGTPCHGYPANEIIRHLNAGFCETNCTSEPLIFN